FFLIIVLFSVNVCDLCNLCVCVCVCVCVCARVTGSTGFHPRERRRVWFSDGILPNGEAAESPKLPAPSQTLAVSQCFNKSYATDLREASSPAPAATVGSPVGSSISLIPEDGLPPILISNGVKGGTGGHSTGA
uniref:Uncharacterized protein n=1 Tax=Hucho hucho TaxID=62062 RepID=A0A4W5LDU2_9TELE